MLDTDLFVFQLNGGIILQWQIQLTQTGVSMFKVCTSNSIHGFSLSINSKTKSRLLIESRPQSKYILLF